MLAQPVSAPGNPGQGLVDLGQQHLPPVPEADVLAALEGFRPDIRRMVVTNRQFGQGIPLAHSLQPFLEASQHLSLLSTLFLQALTVILQPILVQN
jgi:hypothetical protein